MTFVQAGLLFLVVCLFLFLVAQALSSLAFEVKLLRGLVHRLVADDPPKQLAAHEDPIVHDAHSEEDQYESVTKQAESAWSAAWQPFSERSGVWGDHSPSLFPSPSALWGR